MRLDLLLCRLRFVKSRSLAQGWIDESHIRRNGARVRRRDEDVAAGDVLTLPLDMHVAVIEILALPARRGPAKEAQSCYRTVDAARSMPIAEPATRKTEGTAPP